METFLPLALGTVCGILALIGLRELIKELAAATIRKAG
tara:strand:- start:1803 stop:1916 length:114 start_codon:yes stop_codon:yes gene_type:complete